MPKGYIIVNKQTFNPKTGKNHGATLAALGYAVVKDAPSEHFHIECTGFVGETVLDFRPAGVQETLAKVKAAVQAKELFTYRNLTVKAITKEGNETTLSGVHGARYLDSLFPGGSCLVAKDKLSSRKKVAASFSIADILAE